MLSRTTYPAGSCVRAGGGPHVRTILLGPATLTYRALQRDERIHAARAASK